MPEITSFDQAAAEPRTQGSELIQGMCESIFAAVAPRMVELGWSVFPQVSENGRRLPAKCHGRVIHPKTEAHVDAVLPSADLLRDWTLQCASAEAAVMFGTAMPGVFAVDVDVTDVVVSDKIVALAEEHLGATGFMRVGLAPKIALFYRTAADDLVQSGTYRLASGGEDTGYAVEVQGVGRTMTLHGRHHKTGGYYRWVGAHTPLLNPVTFVPEVVSAQVAAFLAAVAAEFPFVRASRYAEGQWAEGDAGRVRAARLVREEGAPLATDGREEILRDLVWRTTRANGRALVEASASDLQALVGDVAAAVVEAFTAAAVCDGKWAPGALRQAAATRVAALAARIRSGDVQPPRGQGVTVDAAGAPRATPVVQLLVGDIANAVDAAEAALVAADRGVYQRAGRVVQLGEVSLKTAAGRETSAQRVFPVDEAALLEHLSVAAVYQRYEAKAEDWRQVTPPAWLATTLASRAGRLGLPVLSGVIGAPTLRPDGSVLDQPGYDDATGLVYDPQGTAFPPVPAEPTREQAATALAHLDHLLSTFPFVSPAHRAVALAFLLTAVVRRCLPAAPGFGFSAPAAGSGKSKLVDMACILATGREAGVVSQGAKEEEDEKRISSLLLDGSSVLALDNCERPVSSALLCQVLTQSTVRPRILGRSESPEVPSSLLVALTGNNLVLVGDLTRRVLLSRLDAGVERPETRPFSNDPVADCKTGRGELVVAALTVLRAYHVAGRPTQASPLGSFGAWSRTVRDALLWLGCADPVSTLDEARSQDPRLASLEAVVGQWLLAWGPNRVSGRDLIRAGVEMSLPQDGTRPEFLRPDLREALLSVAEAGGSVNSRRLSQWLSGQVGRIVSGNRIVRDSVAHGGVQLWRLDLCEQAAADWHASQDGPRELAAAADRALASDTVARAWLTTQHDDLGGCTPDEASRTAAGLQRATELLAERASEDLQAAAESTLGSTEAAGDWLWAVHPALGHTPLEECRDGSGHRRVHGLLETHRRAEHASAGRVVRLTR